MYFCLDVTENGCNTFHRYDYMSVEKFFLYPEFGRRRKLWGTAESLDEVKEDVKVNGCTRNIHIFGLKRKVLINKTFQTCCRRFKMAA